MALALTDNPQISHLSDRFVKNPLEKNREGQWQVTRMVFANERPAWQKCTNNCVQWR
jgi:hypothetical protein